MAKNSKRKFSFVLQKLIPYRGIDLYMTPEGICLIFLGAQIHSSFSVSALMNEIDRYWKLRLN